LEEHNNPQNIRHRYTRSFTGVWTLVYSEQQTSRQDALKREKQLKSYQGRLFIRRLTS